MGGGHKGRPSLSFVSCPSDLVLQPLKVKNCIIVLFLTGAFNHQTERGMRSSRLLTIRDGQQEEVLHMNDCATLINGVLRGSALWHI